MHIGQQLFLTVLIMLSSGIGYLLKLTHFMKLLNELRYPSYFLYIWGISKLLGVIALLQRRYQIIKEWAYAGFSFLLIAATIYHIFCGQNNHAPVSILWLAVLAMSYWSNYIINKIAKEWFVNVPGFFFVRILPFIILFLSTLKTCQTKKCQRSHKY